MPKQKTNTEMILKFIESKKETVSKQTIKTYLQIANNMSFSVMLSQPTIIKKLNELYDNPNTKAMYLNLIILVRRDNDEPTEKLISFRNGLRDLIIKTRKEKMTDIKDDLPTYNELMGKLNDMSGIRYIVNFLFLKYGFRNNDLNLKYVLKLPADKVNENFLIHSKNKVLLNINDYKTGKTFGEKNVIIEDKKFKEELKSLKLKDGDYLISKKNGDKLKVSSFNEKVLNLTIDRLGEAKMFKILIGHLLDIKDFSKIEKLVETRGTSISTIMKSYNIHNNNEIKLKELESKNEE